MRHVCGLDVHKDSVFVCILNEKGVVFQEKIGVLPPELERMVGVIMEHGVMEVGMESTSVYSYFVTLKSSIWDRGASAWCEHRQS